MSKILVLDDDQSNADVIQAVLEDQAFVVVSIVHSDELQSAIKNFQPDLIVMDILLDKGDGREFCNAIKRNTETRNIPVLLITAMLEAQAEKVPSMADGIIFKPFDYVKLHRKVRRLIQ
jgi:CheY-like chemotaxis protein